MPDPIDSDDSLVGCGPDLSAGWGAVPVLVRPGGVLVPGVDDEAVWPAGGGDELRWSFGCDLAGVLAGLDLPIAGPAGGDQDQILADLEALERVGWDGDGGRARADSATQSGPPGPAANLNVGGPRRGGAREARAAGRDVGARTADPDPGDATSQSSSDPVSDPGASGPAVLGPGIPGPGMLGLVADALPAGPGLAAWVAQCPTAQLPDVDLPAVAAALRRVTSWAQAAELAVVAQIAARSAARDPRTGLGEDGRPAAVTRDAAAQAGLSLTLSPGAASWWTELAVTLGWRLPATGAALAAGQIDLARARIIAEATAVLDDDTARAVEGEVLPAAGGQTYGQLRAAVARAVILADPQGAEERRQATERRARVGLYPGDNHTATLTGMNLPAVHAAAAMARLTALARAMQAAGAGGGIDLLRSHAYLGLLLDTLPLIPPRPDAPPDHDPGPDDPGPGGPAPGDPGPGDPGPGEPGPGKPGPGDPGPGEPGPRDPGPGNGGPGGTGDSGPGDGLLDDDGEADPDSTGRPDTAPRGSARRRGSGDLGTPPRPGTSRTGRHRSPSGQPAPDDSAPDDSAPDDSAPDDSAPDDSAPDDSAPDDSAPDLSATGNRPPLGQPGPGGPDPGSARPSPPGSTDTPPGSAGRPGAPDRPDPSRRPPGGPSPGPPGDSPDPPDPLAPPPGSASGTEPAPGSDQAERIASGEPGVPDGTAEARSDRLPPEGWPGDGDAPADDGVREPPVQVPDGYADDGGYPDYDLYDEPADASPIPAWPGLPATTNSPGLAAAAPPGPADAAPDAEDPGRPARGLLELTVAWSALALRSASPATLSRIGPITAEQARLLAAAAATTSATRWRVILTDSYGHALAVTTIPRHATRPAVRKPASPASRAGPPGSALIGRVTVTVPITALDAPLPPGSHPLLPAIIRAAARVLARLQHEIDRTEPGVGQPDTGQPDTGQPDTGQPDTGQPDTGQPDTGQPDTGHSATDTGACAHHGATAAYRPTAAIHDYVTARDQTCRYPCCRQPAWHADLDHTRPWHTGGPTCPCNLGALCRTHHILKQLQGWILTQPRPGIFQWTTPTGRTYTTEPDIHPS